MELGEQCSQLLDFLLIFLKKSIFGVLVDTRLVLDGFGSISVVQGTQGLLVVVISRRESSYHYGFCVTTERVLEETGQLGVTIGHMLGVPID